MRIARPFYAQTARLTAHSHYTAKSINHALCNSVHQLQAQYLSKCNINVHNETCDSKAKSVAVALSWSCGEFS